MRGHNICFHWEIRKIIFELSSMPPLVWSSVYTISFLQAFVSSELKLMLYWLHLYVYACTFVLILFISTTALRKAKIAYNFVLSECNRFKKFLQWLIYYSLALNITPPTFHKMQCPWGIWYNQHEKWTTVELQWSNTYGTMKISLRQG